MSDLLCCTSGAALLGSELGLSFPPVHRAGPSFDKTIYVQRLHSFLLLSRTTLNTNTTIVRIFDNPAVMTITARHATATTQFFLQNPPPLLKYTHRIHLCFPKQNPGPAAEDKPPEPHFLFDKLLHAESYATAAIAPEELVACLGLADLFLDDPVEYEDLQYVSEHLTVAGVTHDQGLALLRNDVFPELIGNLLSVAGVWECWDEEGLMEGFVRRRNRGTVHWVLGEVLWAAPLWFGWKESMVQRYEGAWRYRDTEAELD